jgi:hypothetical protein
MSFKSCQQGGQRRTIEVNCGWRCVGHPTEVNKKYLRHKRYCKDCGDNNSDALPEFCKEGGKINGWKGINDKGHQPNQMLTTAFLNGVRQDILLKDVKNMAEALDDTRLAAALLAEQILSAENPKPLSKSQKKRQKKNGKKLLVVVSKAAVVSDDDEEADCL